MSRNLGGHRLYAHRKKLLSYPNLLYKLFVGLSYIALAITAFYYACTKPNNFWQHQSTTFFSPSSIVTSTYWIILFNLQLVCAWSFWCPGAANIGLYYPASNLLLFGFIHALVRSYFWVAEILLGINFLNLTFAYIRYSAIPRTTPRVVHISIHIGTIVGPLAWNIATLYWVGAVASKLTHPVSSLVANVFIWGWGGCGVFFLAVYRDYAMGFALSALCFSTGVRQFLSNQSVLQLQWAFAFTIGSLLFVSSLAVGLLYYDSFLGEQHVTEDCEKACMLSDE